MLVTTDYGKPRCNAGTPPDAELRRFPSCLWRDSDPDKAGPDEI
jgi:hypothetical protein